MSGGFKFALHVTLVFGAVAAAFAGGAYMAHRSIYAGDTGDTLIYRGAWFTTRSAGSKDADASTRALVAATGLLALPRQETVYFRAHHDDEGRPISSDYDYVVSGQPLPARWWSMTLYDGDHFMNPDNTGPYSVRSTQVTPEYDGSLRIILSKNPQDKNWIGMGTGQNMSLSLRVYNPDAALVEDLESAPVFSIERVER